jgi:hypothetical protein
VNGLRDSGLHIENSRTGGDAIADRERALSQSSDGMDRVMVAKDQHFGFPTSPPMNVWTLGAVNQLRRGTETLCHQRSNRFSGAL